MQKIKATLENVKFIFALSLYYICSMWKLLIYHWSIWTIILRISFSVWYISYCLNSEPQTLYDLSLRSLFSVTKCFSIKEEAIKSPHEDAIGMWVRYWEKHKLMQFQKLLKKDLTEYTWQILFKKKYSFSIWLSSA